MSLRRRGAWVLACAVSLAGCWDSDGFVNPAPTAPETYTGPTGPLASDLPVDGHLRLEGLSAPVDVVRDRVGVVHIYARTYEDAFRAQGYAVARDRAVQVELLRRTALGRVAEILGEVSPETIDQDIVMRTLGLERVAQQEWVLMPPTVSPWVAAYADGVSQYFARIADGTEALPPGGPALHASHFEPYRATDVLAVEKLLQFAMSWSVASELQATRLVSAAGELATSEDEAARRRAGILPDLLRFAPPSASTTLDLRFSPAGNPTRGVEHAGVPLPSAMMQSIRPTVDAWQRAAGLIGRHGQLGSNAWALSPSRSATGRSVLAADAHFRLSSPAPLWMVHLHVAGETDESTAPYAVGAAFPGVPGVAYGFHQHLAWSPVASYFDVTDLYVERLDAAAEGVEFRDAVVPLEVRKETIRVAGGDDVVVDVRVVPHHGPVMPVITDHSVAPLAPEGTILSVRWAGLEPTRDLEASLSLLVSRGVQQALAVVGLAPSAVRSFVFADPDEVMFAAPAHVVDRADGAFSWDAKRYEGTLPCLTLPGQGAAEWVGVRPWDKAPFSSDPGDGMVVAANGDPVGGTLDNDPSNDFDASGARTFLACSFDAGFRQGRIQQRLRSTVAPVGLAEAAAVQGDVRSELASRLVPRLVEALERAQRERQDPGSYPGLTEVAGSARFGAADVPKRIQQLRDWSTWAGYEALPGVTFADMGLTSDDRDTLGSQATLLFAAWLVHVLDGVFADELEMMKAGALPGGLLIRSLLHLAERQASSLASYDPELRDSILWDDARTGVAETRDERFVTALLDALDWLSDYLGADADLWRWGLVHTVRFEPLDPSMALLSIPSESDVTFPDGFPRPGSLYTVDVAAFEPAPDDVDEGPSFRFTNGAAFRFTVAFGGQGPEGMAALAGGQVADPASVHFSDAAEYWRHNATHALLHRRADVVAMARSREVAWGGSKAGEVD